MGFVALQGRTGRLPGSRVGVGVGGGGDFQPSWSQAGDNLDKLGDIQPETFSGSFQRMVGFLSTHPCPAGFF